MYMRELYGTPYLLFSHAGFTIVRGMRTAALPRVKLGNVVFLNERGEPTRRWV